ncbi:MAG: hypothetical protein P8Y24_01020 [Gammaproteobacteria bacterium]
MHETHKLLKRFLGLTTIMVVGVISNFGCSSNYDTEPTQDPTGIWSGRYDYYDPYTTLPGSPESYIISGIVLDGRWMLFYDGVYSPAEDILWEGNPSITGTIMEGSFHLYKNNDIDSHPYHYGNVHTKDFLYGYLESSPDYPFMSGFSMRYSSLLTEAGADLTYIDGNWSDSEQNNLITTLSVNVDGTVYGSNTNGCIYNGMVEIPDQNMNIYKLDVELSICGSMNGIYTGLGYISTDRNLFRFTISNPYHFIHFTLSRV